MSQYKGGWERDQSMHCITQDTLVTWMFISLKTWTMGQCCHKFLGFAIKFIPTTNMSPSVLSNDIYLQRISTVLVWSATTLRIWDNICEGFKMTYPGYETRMQQLMLSVENRTDQIHSVTHWSVKENTRCYRTQSFKNKEYFYAKYHCSLGIVLFPVVVY
jgi:hypothetical protein